MAKVSFTKLGLKPNIETKELTWNEQIISIKQYLPIQERMNLMGKVLDYAIDDSPCYNTCRINVYATVEIILAYSDINVTDKQKEDTGKLYDLFMCSGLGQKILEAIPVKQLDYIYDNTLAMVKGVYKYRNSAVGIMETISQDYNGVGAEVGKIKDDLLNPESMSMLKDILIKMGQQ